MKNKFLKATALVMVIALCCCLFSACGDSAAKGEQKTWGNISVLVPDGMKLSGGSAADKEDKNVVTLQKTDDIMCYLQISIVDSLDTAKNNASLTKSTNNASDIKAFKVGDTEWNGVTYKFSENPCFMIYGEVQGKVFSTWSVGLHCLKNTLILFRRLRESTLY